MSPEKLHEALNYLDDDMIETVEALRNRPVRAAAVWVRWAALAACFCVIAAGIYAVRQMGLEGESGKTPEFSLNSPSDSIEEGAPSTGKPESGDPSQIPENTEVPGVLVTIDAWSDDGFIGTVSGHVDTEVIAVGTPVTVDFLDRVYTVVPAEDGLVWLERVPSAADFPVGSTVYVQFPDMTVHSNCADANATAQDCILHAAVIGPQNFD